MSSNSKTPRFAGISAAPPNKNTNIQEASASSSRLSVASSTKKLLGAMVVPVTMIRENPDQARKTFEETSLHELAEDIKERGILEPLIVRSNADSNDSNEGQYIIVAGARRYRASLIAGLKEVPVIVRDDMDDRASQLAMLVENIQREGLMPQEEQVFFQRLQADFNYSATEIAKLIHKSVSYVTRTINGKRNFLTSYNPNDAENDESEQLIISEDGEIKHNLYYEQRLLENSQFADAELVPNSSNNAPKSIKLSPNSFKKFNQTLDDTLTLLLGSEKPSPKVRTQLKETVSQMRQKLEQLEQFLDADTSQESTS